MADADDLLKGLPQRQDVTYIWLVLNMRGFERARTSGIDEINCVVAASDTFNLRNQGSSTEQTMKVITEIAQQACSENLS